MGHPAGDEVLKQVAGRLRNCVKHRDLVCRMGGDEFTIAIADQPSHNAASDTAIMVAERILESLHQSFNLNQREVFISASIGISIYPNDGNSVIELLKNADMAMYHAKDMGRDNMQFFTASMNRKAVQLLELENDLRHALARNEMQLYFQPQYRTDSEKPSVLRSCYADSPDSRHDLSRDLHSYHRRHRSDCADWSVGTGRKLPLLCPLAGRRRTWA